MKSNKAKNAVAEGDELTANEWEGKEEQSKKKKKKVKTVLEEDAPAYEAYDGDANNDFNDLSVKKKKKKGKKNKLVSYEDDEGFQEVVSYEAPSSGEFAGEDDGGYEYPEKVSNQQKRKKRKVKINQE